MYDFVYCSYIHHILYMAAAGKKAIRSSRPQKPFFPRIVFNGDDISLSNSVKLDPMLRGVDMEALQPVNKKIELMQERLLLPPEYSIHNPFQLLPERLQ